MNETAYVDTPEMTVAKAAAARTLAWGSIGLIPVSFFSAMIAGNPVWAVGSMAALFALLAFFGARNNSVHGRILVGLGLIGQVICITAALSGHPWQLDSHMLFFAVLATLMIMSEPVVILAAAAVIAVHHLSLSIFLPALVYPSSDVFINLKRTIVHGVIVVVEAAVLWVSIRQRNNALWASAAAVKEAAEAADKTEEALEAARGAQSDMTRALTAAKEAEEVANAAREQAETETAKARETDKNARELEARERERTAATEAELSHVVGSLRQALGKLADGNVSEEISDDFPDAYADVKRDFNKTIDELNTVLTSLDRSSNTIVSDVATLEQAAASLSQRTEAQGATLEETAETVNQLADSSKQAAKSASEVNASVSNAKSIANASGKVVEDTVAAMAQIEQSSHQISTIIKMIDDIAFQTNLLALNAGVEAARAGDAGRGFSVVASEVRDLARRSSHAASEIGELVKQSGQNVAIGVEHVEHTGSALQEIIAAIDVISGHVSHIAESTEGQATSISDIHQAMKHLETMTQQNGAMFKETSSVTHSLSEQSKALEETMMRFSIKSDDASGARLTSQPKDLRLTQPVAISHSAANTALAIDETPRRTGWEEF